MLLKYKTNNRFNILFTPVVSYRLSRLEMFNFVKNILYKHNKLVYVFNYVLKG